MSQEMDIIIEHEGAANRKDIVVMLYDFATLDRLADELAVVRLSSFYFDTSEIEAEIEILEARFEAGEMTEDAFEIEEERLLFSKGSWFSASDGLRSFKHLHRLISVDSSVVINQTIDIKVLLAEFQTCIDALEDAAIHGKRFRLHIC